MAMAAQPGQGSALNEDKGMSTQITYSAEELRRAMAEKDTSRPRDIADSLGIGEAALVAARVGKGVVPIAASPHEIIPRLKSVGEVMALTRNPSAVIEKVGVYDNYHPGDHASIVLTPEIDLRIFPSHWKHAFAVTSETPSGPMRSLQVFDAAGDAVHKIYARDNSDLDAWNEMVDALATGSTADTVNCDDRVPTEAPKADLEKADILRSEWARMTDTHQFMRLTSKLKMNRLGAYRIAGPPFVRALDSSAFNTALEMLSEREVPIILFVGNRGCIEIHWGPMLTVKPMGPWQNVLDPGFNLHLRTDHIAEVWLVEKPTKRGKAVSLECFDSEGGLIAQLFGYRRESDKTDHYPAFLDVVETLPEIEAKQAV